MKKFLTLFFVLVFTAAGSLSYSSAGEKDGKGGSGNARIAAELSLNEDLFLEDSPNEFPFSLVKQILTVSAVHFNVPRGILIAAYMQGNLTITFDPAIGGYLVSYGGGLSVVLISDLS